MSEPATTLSGTALTVAGTLGSATASCYAFFQGTQLSDVVAVVSALGTILIPMFKVASDNKNGALRVKVADLEARLASAESERDRLFNLIGAKGAGDVAGVDGGVANPVD